MKPPTIAPSSSPIASSDTKAARGASGLSSRSFACQKAEPSFSFSAVSLQRFRLNGYRVLLTRARAGLVLFVPRGESDDPTRSPDEMDACADALIAAGCAELTQN